MLWNKLLGTALSKETDPYFSNVALLLHCDGSSGSPTFIDSSSNNKSVIAYNGAAINTATKKYGTGAGAFDGVNDHLRIPQSGTVMGNQNFTLECWVYLRDYPTAWNTQYRGAIFSSNDNSNNGFLIDLYGTSSSWTGVNLFINGSLDFPYSFSLNTWYHIAVTKNTGGVYTVYVNGISLGSQTNTNSITSTTYYYIGRNYYDGSSFQYYFNSLIDDFRLTLGVVRYSGNFTPPAGPYPDA